MPAGGHRSPDGSDLSRDDHHWRADVSRQPAHAPARKRRGRYAFGNRPSESLAIKRARAERGAGVRRLPADRGRARRAAQTGTGRSRVLLSEGARGHERERFLRPKEMNAEETNGLLAKRERLLTI